MNAAEKILQVLPDLTDGDLERIDGIIEAGRSRPGSLIPVLEQCQEILGHLPVELQEYIGRGLNIAGSTIYGVVSFYSFFTMVPRGRHVIKVCMGTACYVRGIGEVLSRIQGVYDLDVGGVTADRRFSLEAVRCIGACSLAPAVVIDDETYREMTPKKMTKTLKRYR